MKRNWTVILGTQRFTMGSPEAMSREEALGVVLAIFGRGEVV